MRRWQQQMRDVVIREHDSGGIITDERERERKREGARRHYSRLAHSRVHVCSCTVVESSKLENARTSSRSSLHLCHGCVTHGKDFKDRAAFPEFPLTPSNGSNHSLLENCSRLKTSRLFRKLRLRKRSFETSLRDGCSTSKSPLSLASPSSGTIIAEREELERVK